MTKQCIQKLINADFTVLRVIWDEYFEVGYVKIAKSSGSWTTVEKHPSKSQLYKAQQSFLTDEKTVLEHSNL